MTLSPLYQQALAALTNSLPSSVEVHLCLNCGYLRIDEDPWLIDGGLPCPLCYEHLEVVHGAI